MNKILHSLWYSTFQKTLTKKRLTTLFTLLTCSAASFAQPDLQITEIFSGQAGADLTADWFEISNNGSSAWVPGVDANLYYDDESAAAGDATLIEGITEIPAGGTAIVVIGIATDAITFSSVWSNVINLSNIQIGYTDGAGLGGGGDIVTLWMGDPNTTSPIDSESYPDTELNDGQSYDVALGAFSTVGNANGAVATTILGGDGSDVPNIGSPGDQGPITIDPNAPVIVANESGTALLNISEDGPSYVSGVINDPTDPAATVGIEFLLHDADNAANTLTLSAVSDNQNVVADGNLVFSGTDDVRTLTISPIGVGYATITVTVADPDMNEDTYTISYAASAGALFPAISRFHTGASDGSTAITTGTDYMWVADDEGQTLRLYDKNNSGYPVNQINFDANVGSGEIDLEGSFRNGNTIFWMGSHTETQRSMIFSTTESGSGENSILTFTGYYSNLRQDLINWDNNNVHGKGAGHYNLANTLEVEALAADPNNSSGALLGLRAPVVDGKAIIIPVTNFQTIISPSPVANSATFGDVMEIDLERHSFRSLECNNNGCLIIGGPVENITDFRLFTWSGNSNDAPELRKADIMSLITLGSFEGIVGLPDVPFTGAAGEAIEVNLLVDMGTFNYYNDGSEAKDLPHEEWKKFRSETITLGEVEIPPVALPGDIVITEIMQNPAMVGDSEGEWFEVYNNTFVPIDLNGWTISDKDTDEHTIDNSGPLVIGAGEYLVLGLNGEMNTNGGVQVDYVYSGFTLANGDDELILKASDGMTIDSVAWDNGATFPDPTGASMALQNPNFDNNVGANWCEASTAYGDGDLGTPGEANDCPLPPAANLQITEIWSGNSVGDNLSADWFEITNFGEVAWVSGVDPDLYYDDESQDPVVADLINGITEIQPNESVIVVVGDMADATNFYNLWSPDYDLTDVEIGYTDGAGLGAGGDAVTLFLGVPSIESIVDVEAYPAVSAGGSWDVILEAFSQQGVGSAQLGTNVAVSTSTTNGSEAAIGSPGNKGPLAVIEYDLQITEIFSGQEGDDLTADWFEIVNKGTTAWIATTDGELYYDDESAAGADATQITGISELQPGQTAIVVIGLEEDANTFKAVWEAVIDLENVAIGHTDGAGLGAGGDAVTLWVNNPLTTSPVAMASYPATDLNDGQSYDVELAAFSTAGNSNGAVTTIALGGDLSDIPNIGSPGNGLAIASITGLKITEIFSGQSGEKLTADWFEIKNTGSTAWVSGVDEDLYYDDESSDAGSATLIEGISSIQPGATAIVIIGNETDATTFNTVWSAVTNLNGVEIGYTDGAGLGSGGDEVTLWVGNPFAYKYVDKAGYPDTELNDGQTYDVELAAFSTVNNANNAVQTIATAGSTGDVPNIGSPGNLGPVTGITTIESSSINVFPNPSTGIFKISSTEKITSIKVFDIIGQLVLSKEGGNLIDLSSLPGSVYLLQIETNRGIDIVTITKQ